MKHNIAEINGVVIQPIEIFPSTRHRTLRPPLSRPIPMTAPTTACELDTGTRGIVGRPLLARKYFQSLGCKQRQYDGMGNDDHPGRDRRKRHQPAADG